ncbi:MAG: TraB/GumN family protein [Fibrobacter sp.]|nr:TraB/GumN family protein [Fibrobacter sp.]
MYFENNKINAEIPLKFIKKDEREFILLGTAHISQESVQHVVETIEQEQPDTVCVELDSDRLKALSEPDRWSSLDIKTIIRQKQLPTLIANLVLSSFQKKMGQNTGVKPGTELLTAVNTARENDIPVELIDRNVKITLQRAWKSTPFFRKLLLMGTLVESLFDNTKITEEDLKELQEQDTLSAMMDEMGKTLPELKEVLISERDQYLARKLMESPGKRVLAVVGAGHVPGMERIIANDEKTPTTTELEVIPEKINVFKYIMYLLPIIFVGAMGYLAFTKGWGELGNNLLQWILITGGFGALGAALALPHPLVILVAFIMTPLKPFRPIIGIGVFTSFTQAWFVPPQVHELESVADDIRSPLMWWKNRLLRIFLCVLIPPPFTIFGYFLAGKQIFNSIVG